MPERSGCSPSAAPPTGRSAPATGAEQAYEAIRHTLEAAAPGEQRDRRLATGYHQLGWVAQLRGDLAVAAAWCEKSLEIEEVLGDRPGMAGSYHQLGMVAQHRGDLAAAEDWYQKSLAIFEALGNRPNMAKSYHQLGIVAQDRGDRAAAEAWYTKSLAIFDALGDRPGMAASNGQLGRVAQDRGDLAPPRIGTKNSLVISETLGAARGCEKSATTRRPGLSNRAQRRGPHGLGLQPADRAGRSCAPAAETEDVTALWMNPWRRSLPRTRSIGSNGQATTAPTRASRCGRRGRHATVRLAGGLARLLLAAAA